MDDKTIPSIVKEVSNEGFARKLGLKLIDLTPGHAIVEIAPRKDDTNILGMVHGGAIFSLIDEAFQVSCNSYGTIAVALCVNVVYHSSPEMGLRLRAESTEIHRSNKTATYEINVTDENGALIASCQALAYRKKNKLPFLENKS